MSNTQPPNTKHVITAIEAHWYKSRHTWNENNTTNTEQLSLREEHAVRNSQHNWEYWCDCSAEFTDWEEARTHLEEMNTANKNDNVPSSQ